MNPQGHNAKSFIKRLFLSVLVVVASIFLIKGIYALGPESQDSPDKTFVVTISKMYLKGLRAQQRLRPHTTRNLLLRFEKTYFGDGTGFEVESWWRDFRGKRAAAQAG